MNRLELLGRERWAKVAVVRLNQLEGATTQILRQLAVARLPTLLRDQSACAFDPKPLAKALDLTDPEGKLLCGLDLRQSALQDTPQHLQAGFSSFALIVRYPSSSMAAPQHANVPGTRHF